MSAGELIAMKPYRSASCVAFSTLSTLALVGGLGMSGCGPSEVGSAPSSKGQVSEFLNKEQGSQIAGQKPGKGPQSIKSKLFKAGGSSPKSE